MNLLRASGSLAAIPALCILLALLAGAVLDHPVQPGHVGQHRLPAADRRVREPARGRDRPVAAHGHRHGRIALGISVDPELAARALTNTIAAATPLMMTGLAVGVGFKAGLFNIGGTGQVLVGGFVRGPRRRRGRRAAGDRRLPGRHRGRAAWAARSRASSRVPSRRSPARTRWSPRSCSTRSPPFAIVGLVNDIFKIQGPTFARTADVGNAAMPDPVGPRTAAWASIIALVRPGHRLRPGLPDDPRLRDPDGRREPERRPIRRA